MNVQYISDSEGKTTGVFIPISEWNDIRMQYPELDDNYEIPKWEREIIDQRLDAINQNPESLKPIDELLKEL